MKTKFLVGLVIALLVIPVLSWASEAKQVWELLNPEGLIKVDPMKLAPRITTLEGKTIMLRWNSKHNGDNVLNKVAELLTKEVKNVKIIKNWEVAPETVGISGSVATGKTWMKKLATFKPDIVIASQCD